MACVNETVAAFLAWNQQHRSKNTHRFYLGRLTLFMRHFDGRDVASITSLEIETYLGKVNFWPDGKPKAPDTVRANAVGIETFQKYLLKHKVISSPLVSDLEKPAGRLRERLPTDEEVAAIKKNSSAEFALVYQALRLCGARPNELARASVENWDRSHGKIVLTEHKTARKTGLARQITVGKKLEALCLQALKDRTTGPLFLSPHGLQWTTEALSSAFRRARDRAGLDKKLVLYSARHEHGTAVYRTKGELAAATALGHSSTNMLKRYAHIPDAERQQTQDECGID